MSLCAALRCGAAHDVQTCTPPRQQTAGTQECAALQNNARLDWQQERCVHDAVNGSALEVHRCKMMMCNVVQRTLSAGT